MKVIVVNDDDGHCMVLNNTISNLKKCLQQLINVDRVDDIDEAKELIANENVTLEELEGIMPTGRSNGHILYIEKVEDWPEWDFEPWG